MPTMDYRDSNNEPIPGVTTILQGAEDQSGLVAAANLVGLKGTRIYHLKDRKTGAVREIGEWSRAGDIGTCAHQMIQDHIQGTVFDPSQYPEEVVRLSHAPYGSFLAWREGKRLEGACEVSLTHPEGFGGTIDFIGKSEILDWKTGSDYIWKSPAKLYGQLAAYKYLAEHHGYAVDRVTVVRFPKEGTQAEELTIEPGPKLDAALEMFLSLLKAWKARKIINQKDKK